MALQRLVLKVLVAGAVGTVTLPAAATATPGDLDPNFARGGILQIHMPQEQGVVGLSAGQSGVIRFAGFTGTSECTHFECTSNHRQLLGGVTSDGHLDPSFGDGGLLEPGTDFDLDTTDGAAVLLPNGSFITSLGSRLDRFSPGGSGPTRLPDVDGVAADLDALPSGKLLVGASNFDNSAEFSVERRLASGQPDPSFAANGQATAGIGFATFLSDLVVDPDGSIWLLGHSVASTLASPKLTVARLHADGTPDLGFSEDGIKTFELKSEGRVDRVFGGVAIGGGELIAVADDGGLGAEALRIRSDGTTDPDFGTDGIAEIERQAPGYTEGVADLGERRVGLIRREGLSVMDADGVVDPGFGGDGLADPYGLNVFGGGRSGDGVLVYGRAKYDDVQVARFELTDDGTADADADGIEDHDDACPQTFGPLKRGGCPRVKRTVMLDYGRKTRRFTAHVHGGGYGDCPRTRVRLTRRAHGQIKHRWSQMTPANATKVAFKIHPKRGRFRASIRAQVSPPAGVCSAARSETVRLRK